MPEPARCLRCYYILQGLPEPRCPECGLPFDPADPRTFLTRAPFIWWRFWLPGFLLATTAGLIAYAVLLNLYGYGVAASIATPFCMGAFLGYGNRVRTAMLVLVIIGAVGSVVLGMFSGGLVGVFCGVVLFGVALGPALVGGFAGYLLRSQLKRSRFSQRDWLPMLVLFMTPFLFGVIEGRHRYPPETIRTSVVMPASPADTWDGVMFYEEVRHPPPLLLRLLLPRPLYTRGSTGQVGDIKYCVYSKGRLVKQVTRREEGKVLAFDVVMQQKIEVRSIVLKGGTFEFEPIAPGQTRVTVSTEYEPLLGPRFAWRWAEQWATGTLHRHVLRGMELKAGELAAARAPAGAAP